MLLIDTFPFVLLAIHLITWSIFWHPLFLSFTTPSRHLLPHLFFIRSCYHPRYLCHHHVITCTIFCHSLFAIRSDCRSLFYSPFLCNFLLLLKYLCENFFTSLFLHLCSSFVLTEILWICLYLIGPCRFYIFALAVFCHSLLLIPTFLYLYFLCSPFSHSPFDHTYSF